MPSVCGLGVWSLGFGAIGFRVQCLGFGGLGFGVSGSGFMAWRRGS